MKVDANETPPNEVRTSRPRYVYEVTVRRVVDGDTIDVDFNLGGMAIDLGFGIKPAAPVVPFENRRLRLYGINAPETNRRSSRAAGIMATEFFKHHLRFGAQIYIRTFKTPKGMDAKGKYGRYLALVFVGPPPEGKYIWENSLNKIMVDAGHAIEQSY